ncbi:MAG: aminotransferase class V-fold PLP-dependent enzyme [Syntrophomonadaceae bacterium]|nr:aminotransferase class V-fold PLP-dependent enzyme [Syntrophomonadaceae bacterium]
MLYMDNAATSYPKPESVYVAIDNFNRNMGGNPGRGSSRQALTSGSILAEAREALAALFNVDDGRCISFGPNVTEALNIGLKGVLNPGDHVITTSMEHNAVARPLTALSRQGIQWTRVRCDSAGRLDLEDMRKAIQTNTRMICTLHASNLTGTIMPIKEIGALAREHGLIFMLDSAQSAGGLPLDVKEQNIDILAFTGHKGLLGPQGIGGIYVRPGVAVRPLKEGGTGSLSEELTHPEFMPDLLECGTPNTPGAAGLLAGVEFINEVGLDNVCRREKELTADLITGLREIKEVRLYGPLNPAEQTAVISFNIEDMDCGDVSLRLDYEYGIVTRSGLHCAPLAHSTAGSLTRGSCRLSPGYFTSREDIKKVVEAVYKIART